MSLLRDERWLGARIALRLRSDQRQDGNTVRWFLARFRAALRRWMDDAELERKPPEALQQSMTRAAATPFNPYEDRLTEDYFVIIQSGMRRAGFRCRSDRAPRQRHCADCARRIGEVFYD
jgi:hypothetical protein